MCVCVCVRVVMHVCICMHTYIPRVEDLFERSLLAPEQRVCKKKCKKKCMHTNIPGVEDLFERSLLAPEQRVYFVEDCVVCSTLREKKI